MSTAATIKIAPGYEPITGYVLEKPIGRGGYGEVWQCNAPGGLKKAVKFVFGGSDDTRGSRELKSLERIKGVHHPFLLTLERFGVVDDRLVIVTELADGSLEDIYNRHRDRGSCGIPRKALLKYLHDAADALDYLHSRFQLQHLDIKPGNLLLVGGHVKVGDFGLLKDLREADCSVVGGLTPLYAPPELFDGKPSLNSDQYSLAVMYQELLTGSRPFSGRTIAQLATQHVHGTPDLNPLPAADRPIVARALEKNPERRFENCLEFVEVLRKAGQRSVGQATQVAVPQNVPQEQGAQVDTRELPQLSGQSTTRLPRVTGHALVVALGGTGADCLHELRGRVAKMHAACPLDLHSALIDTTMETIHAARVLESSERIPPCTTLHVPLRTAHQYRDGGTDHLRTISRRWIYNLPRSGSTEGLRPLGRLALVDHGANVTRTLRDAIDHLAAVCGDRTPAVYVIASAAGGTGSGMLFDTAYLLRHLLDQAGLASTKILPVVAAPSLQGNPGQPLALHDTLATMTELNHYLQAGNSYPGDVGAGWPSVPAARSPLADTYIIADGTSTDPVVSPIESIVDYVWADATGANQLLEQARQDNGDGSDLSPGTIRSVGVVRLRCMRSLEENLLAPATARQLMLRWLGRPQEAKQIAGALADRLRRRCGLDTDTAIGHIMTQMGADRDARRSEILQHLRTFSPQQLRDSQYVEESLSKYLTELLAGKSRATLLASMMVGLRRELTTRLQDRRVDITSAIESVRRLAGSCLSQATELESSAKSRAKDLGELDTPKSDTTERPSKIRSIDEAVNQETLRQLDEACVIGEQVIDRVAAAVASQDCKTIAKQLQDFATELESVATTLASAIRDCAETQPGQISQWDDLPNEFQVNLEKILTTLHDQVAQSWLVRPVAESDVGVDAAAMAQSLREAALPLIERIIDGQSVASESTDAPITSDRTVTLRTNSTESGTITLELPRCETETQRLSQGETTPSQWSAKSKIDAALTLARPALLACGGSHRLLLVAGNESELAELEPKVREAHKGSLTATIIPGMTPMLIHEAQQIKASDYIEQLTIIAGGDVQVSGRLQSRTDLNLSR